MASEREGEEKGDIRLKRVGKEGAEGASLPTVCHNTVLAGCQNAPLQTHLQVTMKRHCLPQGEAISASLSRSIL